MHNRSVVIQKQRAAALLLVALLIAACTSPAAAPPAPSVPSKEPSKLSDLLQQLADPAVSALDRAEQARALGLPEEGPGSLTRNGSDEVLVVVRVTAAAAPPLDALAEAGLTVTNVAQQFRSITGFVRPDRLAAVAALPTVEYVREELSP